MTSVDTSSIFFYFLLPQPNNFFFGRGSSSRVILFNFGTRRLTSDVKHSLWRRTAPTRPLHKTVSSPAEMARSDRWIKRRVVRVSWHANAMTTQSIGSINFSERRLQFSAFASLANITLIWTADELLIYWLDTTHRRDNGTFPGRTCQFKAHFLLCRFYDNIKYKTTYVAIV
jgi:hypothetical protein